MSDARGYRVENDCRVSSADARRSFQATGVTGTQIETDGLGGGPPPPPNANRSPKPPRWRALQQKRGAEVAIALSARRLPAAERAPPVTPRARAGGGAV